MFSDDFADFLQESAAITELHPQHPKNKQTKKAEVIIIISDDQIYVIFHDFCESQTGRTM